MIELPEDDSPVFDMTGSVVEEDKPRRRLQRRSQVEEVVAPILEEATQEPQAAQDFVVMKMAQDVLQCTFGAGTCYDFVRARRYGVPIDLRDHLDARALVQR